MDDEKVTAARAAKRPDDGTPMRWLEEERWSGTHELAREIQAFFIISPLISEGVEVRGEQLGEAYRWVILVDSIEIGSLAVARTSTGVLRAEKYSAEKDPERIFDFIMRDLKRHLEKAGELAPMPRVSTSVPGHRDSARYAYPLASKRLAIVREFRKQRHEIGGNKDVWAFRYSISGKTLGNYEKEFSKELSEET